jgi:DNA uptake protein ComE-like DNA-binding protein
MRTIKFLIINFGIFLAMAVFAQVGNNMKLLNPNLASKVELQSLPHVSETLVQEIINARPITTAIMLDGLLSSTLTEPQRIELYGRLFRPINLNTASEEEIMLIPDMTGRMAHEFEEYRPYTSMEQFRREMGKYVNDAEVARLEQYVFSPINLNSASEEDIMTIPGMTGRMAHEFEEYRPYTSMEQFRREMGKYVDDAEVVRLESYITLD